MPRKSTRRPAGKTGWSAPAPTRPLSARTRVALVATQWNTGVVDALVAGARRCLEDHGVADTRIREARVPGAYELPLAVEWLGRRGRVDGVIALGAVIRGDTPHFDFVAGACARGLMEASLRHGLPLGFGVLTVDTAAQAVERAGRGRNNKGYEAAAAMLEMIRVGRALRR